MLPHYIYIWLYMYVCICICIYRILSIPTVTYVMICSKTILPSSPLLWNMLSNTGSWKSLIDDLQPQDTKDANILSMSLNIFWNMDRHAPSWPNNFPAYFIIFHHPSPIKLMCFHMRMRVTDGRSFFKAMDKDNSGTLDVAEVARGLKRLGLDVSAPRWLIQTGKAICCHVETVQRD